MTAPLIIQRNVNLQAANTMGLSVSAEYYACLKQPKDLVEVTAYLAEPGLKKPKLHVLGGGSNVIFKGDVQGLVLHIQTKGIYCLKEDEEQITLQVAAGENWDDFVAYCVKQGFSGIENLSLIPGTVGAAPIQNIGAYGQEVSDTIEQVNCIDIFSGNRQIYTQENCEFAYRQSIFKQLNVQGLLVESVVFRLKKHFIPNIKYHPLSIVFKEDLPTLKRVRDAIIDIRNSKLPNPVQLANTGSFFQNPIVTKPHLQQLLLLDENIPFYPQSSGDIKLAAGYLIEQCGFKGQLFFDGKVGMHALQALVLVNYGNASAKDVLNLAKKVVDSVFERYQVKLVQEPVLI